jgi:hypothetical protein
VNILDIGDIMMLYLLLKYGGGFRGPIKFTLKDYVVLASALVACYAIALSINSAFNDAALTVPMNETGVHVGALSMAWIGFNIFAAAVIVAVGIFVIGLFI